MSYSCKTLLFPVLLLCLLTAGAAQVRATHAAGGELLYEWVSDSTYRFYFKFYRDCSGIPEPDSERMCYFNSCNGQNGSIYLQKMIVLPGGILNAAEVSPGCAGYYTACSGGTLPGFREWWYSGTVTLPSRCNYWTFYIALNGRNPSTNAVPVLPVQGIPLYIEATLDNLHAPGSSSPFFSVKPVPYVCANSMNTYNSGAVDPDNDSISFEFIYPRTIPVMYTGAAPCATAYSAVDIPFIGGFSLSEPFATNNTFTFSAVTGQMSFAPAGISNNAIAIRVNKYRKGVKIGSVMRDIQFQVVACSSMQPFFSVDSSTVAGARWDGSMMYGSTNTTLRFCYHAASRPGTLLSVSDNHGAVMPGSVTAYTGQFSDSVTGCLSWTPSCTDTGLRLFAVTVKDSTCLSPGILVAQTFVVPVYITPSATPTHREIVICPGGAADLRPGSGTAPVSWSVLPGGDGTGSLSCTACRNPVARPAATTTYVARYAFNNSACRQEDRITVTVDTGRVMITPPGPYVCCRPDSLRLQADANGYPYRERLTCGPAAAPASGPQDTAEVLLVGMPLQRVQNNAGTPFTGSRPTTRHQYLVRAADLKAAGITSGTLRSLGFHISSFSPGSVFSNLRISLACTGRNALDPAAGFVSGTVPVYTATAPVAVTAAGAFISFPFDVPYDWDTTQNLVVDICYANAGIVPPAYTYYFNSGYMSMLYAYAASGSVCDSIHPAVAGAPELPHMRFGYQPAPAVPYRYRWQNGVFFPSDTVRSPVTYITESTRLFAYTSDRYGCVLGDTLEVIVPPRPALPGDTGICAGDAILLPVSNGARYQWYENGFNPPATLSCTTCASPVARPADNTTYTVIVTGPSGCADTLQVQVQVTPVPRTRILNSDTLVMYGTSVRLHARGADHYLWSPAHSVDDPALADPLATLRETTLYIVAGSAAENIRCRSYDSLQVRVNYRGVFYIPSAFTPGADGKNDVFRIANLTFQKVTEFRVFNRWGQEVFSAAAGRTGWDGTWKGTPQPVGVYYYLIRLAYPDGTTEMFKGDVTLIR